MAQTKTILVTIVHQYKVPTIQQTETVTVREQEVAIRTETTTGEKTAVIEEEVAVTAVTTYEASILQKWRSIVSDT
ncbi:hypothetical protein A2U01_0078396, partial [Trifolium medium]|nr:hypothetical protein [Trifolium medium]